MKRKECFKIRSNSSESGNASLVAIIFIAFAALTFLTVYGMKNYKEMRNLEKSRSILNEKWQARSQANILSQVVRIATPRKFETDVREARQNCSAPIQMRLFDAEDINPNESRSVVIFNEDGDIICNELASSPTSVFGTFVNWSNSRLNYLQNEAATELNVDGNISKIVEFQELYRRSFGSEESNISYAVRFIVESKIGQYRTRSNGEIILGASLPTCGTSATLEAVPTTVERGNPVTLNITYSYANRLQIYNSANVLVHEANVTEQSTPQVYPFTFSPAITDTYRVTAFGSGGCQARSANVVITVTEPPVLCPRVVDFSASSLTINEGETVTLNWNVQDAASVSFEGTNVSAIGSQSFTLNATRTFTLTAQDTANNCPVTRQITVTVRPLPPSCAFGTPRINFSANPTTIVVGGTSTLNWSISDLASSGTAVITGANGFNQSIGVAGSQLISPPNAPADYTYTLTAENVCADGTRLTAQANVIISVRSCPPPSINVFSASPSIVIQGENRIITLAWNIDGTADAVSISNGVGGGLPSSGSVDIPQPQTTTTYTLTTVGCGQTRQAQITIIVNPPPEPPVGTPYSCPLWGNQEQICSVVIGGNCTNAEVTGNIDSDGATATGTFTVAPGYSFGQDYLIGHTFILTDSANRQVATASVGYTGSGQEYLIGSTPSNVVISYSQNSLTWRATLLPNAPNPNLNLQVRLDYGAAAGASTLVFNSSSSCGGIPNSCSRNLHYDLQAYSFPTNQFIDLELQSTVSSSGVLNGTLSLPQVVSESVNQTLYVQIRDSLDRQVFAQTLSGASSSYVQFNNIAPLSPSPPNNSYSLSFQWSGTTTSNESQSASDTIIISESGCP